MKLKNILKRIYTVGLLLIVTVSLIWTFLSVILFVRVHSGVSQVSAVESQIKIHNATSLPKFYSDKIFFHSIRRLADLVYGQADSADSFASAGQLKSVNIQINPSDSTYCYQFLFIRDCGCPAVVKDRLELTKRFVNPLNFSVIREEIKKNLSAEEVNRYIQPLFY